MKKILLILTFSFFGFMGWSQIGINNSNPDPSSLLDISSTDKGLLLPRVSLNTNADLINPISAPSAGLLVWNTNQSITNGNGVGIYYFNGSLWSKFIRKGSLDECYDQGGVGLGRTINADSGAIKIVGTDGLLINGNFGLGSIIDLDVTGSGTRMFFNPFKSAFRAGGVTSNFFDNTNLGGYSIGLGFDNRIVGSKTFGANNNNETSSLNATSFGNSNTSYQNTSFSIGNSTRSGGNYSFSSGLSTFAIGFNSFTGGIGNRSNSINEVAFGVYCKTPAKTNSSGTLGLDSQSTYYNTDRVFAIGNGTVGLAKNAFEVWKNGRVMINSSYSLPTTDGTAKQTVGTNGTSTLTWRTPSVGITQIPLYADDVNYSMSNITPATDLIGVETALIPSIFQAAGNVRVKLVIRYSSLTGTPNFRLRIHDGTTQSTPITTAAVNWINTPTQFGGIYESTWRNWTGATGVYEAHLSGFMTNTGESIAITNAYLLIAPQ